MARKQENKVVMSNPSAVPARRKPTPPRVSRPVAVEVSSTPVSHPEVLPVASAAAPAASIESFQDAVARLAFSYWESRGRQGGSPEADWLRAEQELRAK